MTATKTIREQEQAVVKLLNEHGLFHEVYQYSDLPVICVEINWGDWKHDHGAVKYLVTEVLGGTLINSIVTEENGSDCYSAIHYFAF